MEESVGRVGEVRVVLQGVNMQDVFVILVWNFLKLADGFKKYFGDCKSELLHAGKVKLYNLVWGVR